MKLLQLIVIVFCCHLASAQKIDHTVSFRDIDSPKYFRFNYENDFFSSTDRDYTQGYSFELALPWFKKNPINKLFVTPEEYTYKYGLAVEHFGFTPDKYELPDIQFGDRPFAAAIVLRSFSIGVNTVKLSRLSSALSLGIIGPGAFGEELQAGIHELTGNDEPLGWQNQIKNDVVVHYEVTYEKQLFSYNDYIALQAESRLKLGTIFTNISFGASLMVGLFDNPFKQKENKRNFQIYAFAHPQAALVGYDATLQGGVFNRKSPYTINDSDVERVVLQNQMGVIMKINRFYIEYNRADITREFSSGNSAGWGGFKLGYLW